MEQIQHIDLDAIRLDGGTQPRAALNEETIADYVAALRDGAALPPVGLVYDGADYWLHDGFHRVTATRRAGHSSIPADIRQGTRRDAVLLSVGANATHGLRRTNADKRRAVETLLNDDEWSTWSNREIARRCSVSHKFVNEVRNSHVEPGSSESRTYTTKHNSVATMHTANIGKSPPPAPAPIPGAAPVMDISPTPHACAAGEQQPPPPAPPAPPHLPTSVFPCDVGSVTIHHENCLNVLNAMEATTIDLVVTSPPYNVGVPYDGYYDQQPDYWQFTRMWLQACVRVLREDGRMCLNVPLDTANNPTFGYEMAEVCQLVGFSLKTTIVWNEQNISKSTAWGSWMSASAPHVIAPVELILVLYKDRWKKDRVGTSTITADEYKAWAGAGGVWAFPGERKNGHPAAFPVELPRRCLKLFSYADDTILDPFAGIGTTGMAARELARRCILIEQSEQYCKEAVWRLT